MAKNQLKGFEWLTILIGLAGFAGALFLYGTDYPIVREYLGVGSGGGAGQAIGTVATKSGTARQQLAGESDFKSIEVNDPIHDRDVLVTGPDSEMTLSFKNGGGARLGSGTMLRLSFTTNLTLGGIKRYSTLEVVSGKVVGQAGKQQLQVRSQNEVITVKPNMESGMEVVKGAGGVAQVKVLEEKEALPETIIAPAPSATPTVTAPVEPPPSPSPTPKLNLVRILAPPQIEDGGTAFSGSSVIKKVRIRVGIYPADSRLTMTISKEPTDRNKQGDRLFDEVLTARRGQLDLIWETKSPGKYRMELRGEEGEDLPNPENSQANFTINPEINAIKVGPALISGTQVSTSKIENNVISEFDVSVNWEPLPGVKAYKVWFSRSPSATRPLLERMVEGNEFHFNRNKVLTGDLYYTVSAPLDKGFVAVGPIQHFSFTFIPPQLTSPSNNGIISKKKLMLFQGDFFFLTWEKTNFTQKYEIQVATDPNFTQIITSRAVKENYFLYQKPRLGQYWWRVRSIAGDLASMMSDSRTFTISP